MIGLYCMSGRPPPPKKKREMWFLRSKRRMLNRILLLMVCNFFVFLTFNPIHQNSDLESYIFCCRNLTYILESNPHPNLIRTSFCPFLKRKKKKLVRGSNPHLFFNRPLRAAPSEVARWVSAAWKAIPESIIVRSFKKCCISNALDVSEMTLYGRTMVKIKTKVTGWRIAIHLWVMTASLTNNKL